MCIADNFKMEFMPPPVFRRQILPAESHTPPLFGVRADGFAARQTPTTRRKDRK